MKLQRNILRRRLVELSLFALFWILLAGFIASQSGGEASSAPLIPRPAVLSLSEDLPPLDGAEEYRQAVLAEESGRIDEAADIFLRLLEEGSILSDHAAWRLARLYDVMGRAAEADLLYAEIAGWPGGSRFTREALLRLHDRKLISNPEQSLLCARRLLEFAHTPAERAEAVLREARAQNQSENYGEAARLYRIVMKDYADEACSLSAANAYSALQLRHSESVGARSDEDRLRQAELYYRHGAVREARDQFRALRESGASSVLEPELIFWIGRCHERLGAQRNAEQTYHLLLRDYSGTVWDSEAEFRLGLFDQRTGRRDSAEARFLRAARMYSHSSVADEAWIKLAEFSLVEGRFIEAGLRLDHAVSCAEETGDEKTLWEAVWLRCRLALLRSDWDGALPVLERLGSASAPGYREASLYWQGRCHAERGRPAEARRAWGDLLVGFPPGYYSERALSRLADLPREESVGDIRSAIASAGERLAAGDRVGGINRILRACSLDAEARSGGEGRALIRRVCEHDPVYEAFSNLSRGGVSEALWQSLIADQEGSRRVAAAQSAGRLRALLSVALWDEALQEADYLSRLTQGHPAAEYAAALCERRRGNPLRSIRRAERLRAGLIPGLPNALLPEAVVDLLYPRHHWETVRSSSDSVGIDPFLVTAIVREESRFEPAIVSRAGAVGLMQVMPRTGRWLARRMNMPYRYSSLNDPDYNVRLGSFYLDELIEEQGGVLEKGIACYNAGPGNVRRWKALFPTTDQEVFVECLLFDETRMYVKRVLGSYWAYREIYGDRGESLDSISALSL